MKKIIRFGAFIRGITIRQQQVSYNELTPKVEKNEEGKEMPHHASRLQVRSIDVYRILKPYINTRLKEQIKAVVPLAVYLVLFQIIILRQGVTDSWQITGGMISVIIGLMFFMEGLKVGLMPFGESIGNAASKIEVTLGYANCIYTGHWCDLCRTCNWCTESGWCHC